jgi:hypothetical protein
MVKKNYEGEWSGEMILEKNPNGGRPMRIGSMLFSNDDYRQEVGIYRRRRTFDTI